MKNLSSYLSRFKKLRPPKRTIQKAFMEVVLDVCNITLKQHEISVHGSSVFVTTNPVIKNEIMLKKALILRNLSQKTLGIKIAEIR